MMSEEEKFLLELGEKIDKLIDKEFEKRLIDRAFFDFLVKVNIFNDSFEKFKELTILDTREQHFCMFCRKEAHYFYEKEQGYLCAECYSKIFKKEE